MADTNDRPTPEEATLSRLDDQLRWYSRASAKNQRWYRGLKLITISAAAVIPILATMPPPYVKITAGLGILIAIVEGVQQVNQYHSNWTAYRATAEVLKHERFLYLANAGPYHNNPDAQPLLAQRVEGAVSQEQAKWQSLQTDNAPQKPTLVSPGNG